MTCANCGYGTDELYICEICGDEVCDDCSIDTGIGISDIKMICVKCIDKDKQ